MLGQAAPQALRVLGDHYSTPWPTKLAHASDAAHTHIVRGGVAHPDHAYTGHMLLGPQVRKDDHPVRTGGGHNRPACARRGIIPKTSSNFHDRACLLV